MKNSAIVRSQQIFVFDIEESVAVSVIAVVVLLALGFVFRIDRRVSDVMCAIVSVCDFFIEIITVADDIFCEIKCREDGGEKTEKK